MTQEKLLVKETLDEKIDKIRNMLEGKKIAVAFSGGLDSTLVAYFSKKFGKTTWLVHVDTPLITNDEKKNAETVADWLNLPLVIIKDDLPENVLRNPVDRCYYCKTAVLGKIIKFGEEKGADLIVDGTNKSDLGDYRPGLKAIKEKNVRSPLLEAGLSKNEIRQIARKLDLINKDWPSNSCLAARIPYNTRITPDALRKVELAEKYLREKLDPYQLRVRLHEDGNIARIELDLNSLKKIVNDDSIRTSVIRYLSSIGIPYVTIDLEGYTSGSMNKVIKERNQP